MSRSDYQRVADAIAFIAKHQHEQPSLDAVAAHLGLSPLHVQRLFSAWAGVSPKRFLQALTVERAKEALAQSRSVLDAAFDAGLSSPGRLHDLMLSIEAVSPGEYKRRGEGLVLRYATVATPFGDAFVAHTERGVCALRFVDDEAAREDALASLAREFAAATRVEDPTLPSPLREALSHATVPSRPLSLLVRGTNLQVNVWRALLRVPEGCVLSYQDLAARVGAPRATRAVASAVAANPVGFLVPCHRVLRGTGALGGYRWGLERKRAMLLRELSAGP